MKAIGYIRISTGKQDYENQRSAINEAAAREGMKLSLVEDTVSSRKAERKIYNVVENLNEGETLIVYEPSRLARSIGEVFEIAQKIKRKKAGLWILQPEIRTGDGGNEMQSDLLLFALSMAAQIERDLISERTKNALRARKEQGVKLGRPEGKGEKVKEALKEKGLNEDEVLDQIRKKIITAAGLSRLLGIDSRTVREWLKREEGGHDRAE
ncbi:MAG: recombinase family protein [Spirochaetaceae bacterium]|nr:recombinase family protein [Spirochaetia bacterium]MCF7951881.1 recombinase family protein [Spirochaetaceae bacterium]